MQERRIFHSFLRGFVSREILSLICRFCIFVVRNVAVRSPGVIPAWPPLGEKGC
jgi:hypothetical protein